MIPTIGCLMCAQISNTADVEKTPHTKEVKATSTDTCDTIDFGEEEVFTLTKVAAAIRGLKFNPRLFIYDES